MAANPLIIHSLFMGKGKIFSEAAKNWRNVKKRTNKKFFQYPVDQYPARCYNINTKMKENDQEQAMQFGQRVKEIRKILKLSQKDFAEPLGISGTFVSEVESGKYKPCYDFFYNIMGHFNVNLHYLFTGQGEMFIRDMNPAETEIEEPFSSITKTGDILWYMTRSPMFMHSMFGFASRYLYENRTYVELEIESYKAKKSAEKNKPK